MNPYLLGTSCRSLLSLVSAGSPEKKEKGLPYHNLGRHANNGASLFGKSLPWNLILFWLLALILHLEKPLPLTLVSAPGARAEYLRREATQASRIVGKGILGTTMTSFLRFLIELVLVCLGPF